MIFTHNYSSLAHSDKSADDQPMMEHVLAGQYGLFLLGDSLRLLFFDFLSFFFPGVDEVIGCVFGTLLGYSVSLLDCEIGQVG